MERESICDSGACLPKSVVREAITRLVVGAVKAGLGRRNTVRLGRYLSDHARLDIPNRIASNGELLVQRLTLERCSRDGEAIVFDVGAHFGEWSTHLVSHATSLGLRLSLHIFEPAGDSFERVKRCLLVPPGVAAVINHQGLSSRRQSATLHKPHGGAGSSTLHPGHVWDSMLTERVELTSMDDYCDAHGIATIDLVKCDAEGHDMEVLAGATGLLSGNRIPVVQFEYNGRWVFARRFLLDAFNLLQPFGYQIGKVTPKGIEFYEKWDLELETFREGNYVAVTRAARSWFPAIEWWK